MNEKSTMELSDAVELCSINVGNAAQTLKLIIYALEDDNIRHVIIQEAMEAVYFILDSQAEQLSNLAAKI